MPGNGAIIIIIRGEEVTFWLDFLAAKFRECNFW